jgi:hypothetical protein
MNLFNNGHNEFKLEETTTAVENQLSVYDKYSVHDNAVQSPQDEMDDYEPYESEVSQN